MNFAKKIQFHARNKRYSLKFIDPPSRISYTFIVIFLSALFHRFHEVQDEI